MSESTGSMWLRMLGLEDIWRTANSPDFQAQIASLVAAILETRIRCERIEYKLDALLDKLGHDDIPRRFPTLISATRSSNGAGAFAAASAAADARSGEPANTVEPVGEPVDRSRAHDFAPRPAAWRPY